MPAVHPSLLRNAAPYAGFWQREGMHIPALAVKAQTFMQEQRQDKHAHLTSCGHDAMLLQDMLSAVATSPDAYILHHPCARPLLDIAVKTLKRLCSVMGTKQRAKA